MSASGWGVGARGGVLTGGRHLGALTSLPVLGPTRLWVLLLGKGTGFPAQVSDSEGWGQLTPAFHALTAAPGTGGLKFNIQKRPFPVTNQNFSSTTEGQHSGFGPQPNPEKVQNHR